MKRFLLTMILLLAASVGYGSPDTPGTNTGVLAQFYEDTWGTDDGVAYVTALTSKGYVVTEAAHLSPGTTAPSFGMDDFYYLLDNSYGVWWIQTHGHGSGVDGWTYGAISVEPYDRNSMAVRDNNWDFYLAHGWTSASIERVTTAESYCIALKSTAISSKFTSNNTFVFNWACGSSTWESSWGSRRVFCGFAASNANYAQTFWESMGSGSTVTSSRDGSIVVAGEGATILAPEVVESPEFGLIVPAEGLDVEWTFTGAMTGTPTGDGLVQVCSGSWADDHTYRARLCATGNGTGWVTGNFTSGNGIPIVHLTDMWGFFVGTNGAADVHFSVEGQTAKWLVGSEYRTEAYYVESAATTDGPWEIVGIEQGPGFTEYQLDISDALASGHEWFRLCEREENNNGDAIPPNIIVHGYAQPTVPLARPAMQALPRTLDYFEQAIADQQAARDRGEIVPVLPMNIGDGETLVCYTVAPFAAAVEQYAAYRRLFGYTVLVDVVPGYPQTPEEEDAQIAYLQSRIALHTAEGARYHFICADDNDYHYFLGTRWSEYWTGPWASIRLQMLYRYQPQLDHVVIPGFTVRDDLPRGRNLAWWWPYYRTDQPYELPGTVVTRLAVTELLQIAAASLVAQESTDYWTPWTSSGVGLFVGDMDHIAPGDGAVAAASADTVRTLLQSHGNWTSEVKESVYRNPELRNSICADQWNGNMGGHTNLNIMFASQSGPHYPGNMYSKRELGDYVWSMDLVWPFMNHHPFFIGATCGTAAIAPTDDAAYYHTPVVEDMMFHEAGAVGFYGPSCGSLLSSNKVIGYHVTAKILEDPMRPIFESIALAEEEMAVLYANRPWVIRQLNTMMKIGDPLTRLGPVMVPVGVGDEVPNQTSLATNFPNPFNPQTAIRFATTREDHVSLKVFNVRGGLVATLVDGTVVSGQHQIVWNGTDDSGQRVASGTYFYRLEAEGRSITRKMLLLK
ncbi:MAG: FlgD immunoglobulin-like domain containing protein [Patescibacteria group bacterium]